MIQNLHTISAGGVGLGLRAVAVTGAELLRTRGSSMGRRAGEPVGTEDGVVIRGIVAALAAQAGDLQRANEGQGLCIMGLIGENLSHICVKIKQNRDCRTQHSRMSFAFGNGHSQSEMNVSITGDWGCMNSSDSAGSPPSSPD